MTAQPVFRFAPSPNGFLHLGHARSALLNDAIARRIGGRMLLRIEDIDTARTREAYVRAIVEDLRWLGLDWPGPPLRQSTRFAAYREAAERLRGMGLLYPCRCSRTDIARAAGDDPQRDPDGAVLYPGTCRKAAGLGEGPLAWRLDMRAALALRPGLARWTAFDAAGRETCETGDPAVWGDAILLRKEFPASYHLAVVVDDAASGVTHVVRGEDLHAATALHRLLQDLLGYSAPAYCHHPLIVDAEGRKLSKSDGATALRDLAAGGLSPAEARRMALGGLAAHRIESDSPEDRR